MVELISVVEGLQLPRSRGFRHITIQVDSLCAVQLLEKKHVDMDHRHVGIVARYTEQKQRNWSIAIQHDFREANFLADHLANMGHALPFGTHIISHDDPYVVSWSAYDKERSSRVRLVKTSV
ncbi:hypothetical protein LINPERPRIM_LOCUS23416 [Linum perenne]